MLWWNELDERFTSLIKRGDLYYFKDDQDWIYIGNPIKLDDD